MSLPDVDTRSAVAVDHLLALAAVNAVSGLSQTVQIGALPLLIGLVLAERGSDPATIGLIAAAPWVAILLLSRFVPAVLWRVGLLRGVLIGVLLSAASVLAMGGSTHPALLFVLNAAVGAGLILRWIACDTWIVSIAPKAYRGRAIGVHETLMGLGIAAGPLVLAVTGTDGPWPTTACVLLLLAGLAALPMLRRWDRRGEDRGASETVSGLGGPWRMLRLIPVGLIGAFTAGFVETSSVSLLAVYAMDVGYTVLVATLLVASFGAGGTLLQLPIGWLGDRIGSRHAHALCAAIILAGAVLVPAVLPVVWLAAAVAFCWGGAIGGMNTLAVMEAGERASDGDMAGAMTAVAFFYTLGSVAGPPVSGALMRSWSVHGLMIAAGAVSVVFLATAAGLRRTAVAEPGG